MISSIFGIVVVISNIISTKMIKLPLFQDFSIPAGLITYPLTFFISDLVTEVYGAKKAKEMVYLAFGMSVFAYLIIKIALILPSPTLENQTHFEEILGLNGMILMASLTAYIFSQMIDIQIYSLIKKWTGQNYLWIRTNGSTLIAQLVDTMIVNLIYLKGGAGMDMAQILPIMAFSYAYKCSFSIAFTPLFYFLIFLFKNKNGMAKST
jgi:uncharacterized integral membrane protein (TIGR00697 family)